LINGRKTFPPIVNPLQEDCGQLSSDREARGRNSSQAISPKQQAPKMRKARREGKKLCA